MVDKLKVVTLKLFLKELIGHTISMEGISTDKKKIEAVQSRPTPQTLTNMHRFIGLCSCYRRFICGFASIAELLHRLDEKEKPFQ